MKDEKEYIQNLTEIRFMMEQSSKFLSLSGWAGIMAGVYALTGSFIAYYFLGYKHYPIPEETSYQIYLLALVVLIVALLTAVYLSYKQAEKSGKKLWNHTARRLLTDMAVPLSTGGVLIVMLLNTELRDFIIPISLIFYGLALYNAGKFTVNEVRVLGIVQVILGLLSTYFIEYGLIFWALGFGLAHMVYGIYMHYKYEK